MRARYLSDARSVTIVGYAAGDNGGATSSDAVGGGEACATFFAGVGGASASRGLIGIFWPWTNSTNVSHGSPNSFSIV